MEANQFLLEIFAFVQTIFGLVIGVIIIQFLAFLFYSKLLEESDNPKEVAKAIFGYLMLTIGVLLMSLSVIPTLIAVLGGGGFTEEVYFSLVLVFAMGGLLYLWHDHRLQEVRKEAKRIPGIIYFYTIKAIGQLSLLLSILYLTLTITLQGTNVEGWWGMPLSIFLYGTFLSWLTMTKPPKKKVKTPVKKREMSKKKRKK